MSSSTISTLQNNDPNSKRRRFQPPITTFFTTTAPTDPTNNATPRLSHTHYAAETFSPTPVVPAKVQASLLSVGMRVRKSVAEGYKTKINMITEEKQPAVYSQPQPRTYPSTVRSELAPYSGMGRIIGNHNLGTQPYAEPLDPTPNDDNIVTDDGDAFSLPPSSQESVASLPPLSNAQKRSFDHEDDADTHAMCSSCATAWLDPMQQMNGNFPAGRTILAPRLGLQRRRFVTAQKQGAMDVDDFEEPAFLRGREEVDIEYGVGQSRDYEVQMGGM